MRPAVPDAFEKGCQAMTSLIIAIALTLGISAICSLLEAFILSTTTAEIEGLKKKHLRSGLLLERFREQIDESSSSILTLNTIANTAGAIVVGSLNTAVGALGVVAMSVFMTVSILVFSEVIPKTAGVAYRKALGPYLVYPLWGVRTLMKPFSFIFKKLLTGLLPMAKPTEQEQEEEILLLAEKSVRSGALLDSERELIINALSLDDMRIEDIMTPRTVVTFLPAGATVAEVCQDFKNIPFARMPLTGENTDDIVGLVRRRDILQAYSEDKDELTMREMMKDVVFAPETASALDALQLFTKKQQQFAVVVDEYGSTVGVITMEDIVEHLIGEEIYESSDVAVDMRELAKKRAQRRPAVTRFAGMEGGTVEAAARSAQAAKDATEESRPEEESVSMRSD